MEHVISVEHLKKTYGSVAAVNDVSFNVTEGEIFGLLGPNGAGKTTTVECLQGLRSPDSGIIRILGFNPQFNTREIKQQIGSQLQESALPDRIRVWEALDLFASVANSSRNYEELIQQWGLADKRKASYSSLSGGQRQRLLVALALVNNPRIIFLDEMTTGLDPAARRTAWELIRAIREQGTTVVLVTHFMDEAEYLCDRLAIMDNGQIAALDTPQGLITTYAGQIRIIFTTDIADISWLHEVPYVEQITRRGPRVEVQGNGPVLALVAAALVEHDIIPLDLRTEQPSLEDVFLKITGYAIED